jgi:hypothetical protein
VVADHTFVGTMRSVRATRGLGSGRSPDEELLEVEVDVVPRQRDTDLARVRTDEPDLVAANPEAVARGAAVLRSRSAGEDGSGARAVQTARASR